MYMHVGTFLCQIGGIQIVGTRRKISDAKLSKPNTSDGIEPISSKRYEDIYFGSHWRVQVIPQNLTNRLTWLLAWTAVQARGHLRFMDIFLNVGKWILKIRNKICFRNKISI